MRKALLFLPLLLVMVPFAFCDVSVIDSVPDPELCYPNEPVTWAPELNITNENASLSFDGVNQYVNVLDHSSLDNILTFEAWVYPIAEQAASGAQNHLIVTKHADWRHGLFYRYDTVPDRLAVSFYDGLTESSAFFNIPNFGVWYHLVGFFDIDGRAKLYVNGAYSSQGVITTGTQGNNINPLRVGGGIVNRYTKIIVDEVRCYSRRLTPTEIEEHYNGIFENESGIVLWLRFDGDVIDYSGLGNDGTLMNGPTYVTDGKLNLPITTDFNGTIQTTDFLVNSTTSAIIYPLNHTVTAPDTYGYYDVTTSTPGALANFTYINYLVLDTVMLDLPLIWIVFTTIAGVITIYGYKNPVIEERMLAFGFALIFWIASIWQWVLDTVGTGSLMLVLVLMAPFLASIAWFLQAFGAYVDKINSKEDYDDY